MQMISKLEVNTTALDAPTFHEMMSTSTELVQSWAMSKKSLDTEWKELSGGEAQRVVLAVAIASRPRVLLLDESTSALDMDSKLRVEQSIERFTRENAIAVFWITRDKEPITRLEKFSP